MGVSFVYTAHYTKDIEKILINGTKNPIDKKRNICYSYNRVRQNYAKIARKCDEAGDCVGKTVTSVEYVRSSGG